MFLSTDFNIVFRCYDFRDHSDTWLRAQWNQGIRRRLDTDGPMCATFPWYPCYEHQDPAGVFRPSREEHNSFLELINGINCDSYLGHTMLLCGHAVYSGTYFYESRDTYGDTFGGASNEDRGYIRHYAGYLPYLISEYVHMTIQVRFCLFLSRKFCGLGSLVSSLSLILCNKVTTFVV